MKQRFNLFCLAGILFLIFQVSLGLAPCEYLGAKTQILADGSSGTQSDGAGGTQSSGHSSAPSP